MSVQVLVREKRNDHGSLRSFWVNINLDLPKKPNAASDDDWESFKKSLTLFSILQQAQYHVSKQWAGEPEYEIKEGNSELTSSRDTKESLQGRWCFLNETSQDKTKLDKEESIIQGQYRGLLGVTGAGAALSIPGICLFAAGILVPALSAQALALSYGVPGIVMFVVGVSLIAASEVFSRKMKAASNTKAAIMDEVVRRSGLWSDTIHVNSKRTLSRSNSFSSKEEKGPEEKPVLQRVERLYT